ncbi:MAG: universal stress protein [Deltaproteobacteria bacterium]|nr:universal stress protein [Deltaproteobacteria bacterium]
MLPFKKILCPTDFSEPSYEAIKTAGELAYHFGSELCIVHVITPVPIIPMPMGPEPAAFNVSLYEQELEASSKRSLEEVVNQLESKELKTRLIALRGNPADEIVRTADEENVDLIVIATRGRTGLDRLIFGSVTEKVMRLAKCPVLTVTIKVPFEEGEETLTRREVLGLSEKKEVKLPEAQLEKKKAYQEKIEGQLKEWGARIDELMAKAETSRAELKVKYEKQIEDLRAQQEALKKNLQEFKESGEEAWEHLKTGIEKNFDELKDSADRTISLFKEKGEDVAETVSKKKKAYVEKVEDQLKEWGNQIDILKAKAEKSKAEIKIKYLEQVEELRKKQETVKKTLHQFRESGDEAWEDLKDGMDRALDDLKKSLKRAVSRFKEK